MAYQAISNSKFQSGKIAEGADIAQLNDNIEDTRGANITSYATVYEWSTPIQITQSSVSSTDEIEIVFANPTTTTYHGKTFDALNSNNRIDLTNTRAGDNITFRIYYDDDYTTYPSGGNTTIQHGVKAIFSDSSESTFISTRDDVQTTPVGVDEELSGNLNLGLGYSAKNGEVILKVYPLLSSVQENLSIKKLEFLVNFTR